MPVLYYLRALSIGYVNATNGAIIVKNAMYKNLLKYIIVNVTVYPTIIKYIIAYAVASCQS
jgi:hypothetical protein